MFKKILAAAALIGGSLLSAQAQTTTVTASNLKISGFKIPAGTVTLTPVQINGIPIPFADGTGAQNGPTAFQCQITNGAIGGALTETGSYAGTCQVPDATMTVPANILYQIQVADTSTGNVTSGKSYTLQSVVGVSGTTWPLDHYGPPSTTTNAQTVQFAQGTSTPTSCISPYIFTNTTTQVSYTCIAPSGGPGTYVSLSTGPAGQTGPAGVTPAISVGTVTTGAPGSSAQVTVTGPSTAPVLNFSLPTGATGPAGGGSGTTISGLTFTKTDTTIVAQWTTSSVADSNLYCGNVPAKDNGFQQGITSGHEAIVTGLSPGSNYSCYVVSAGTNSTPQIVTTNAIAVRNPILSTSALGTATSTAYFGDTLNNFVQAGTLYMGIDDTELSGTGAPCPVAGANMALTQVTNEATLAVSPVNCFTNYGAWATVNGTDGPYQIGLANKETGVLSINGTLFVELSRSTYMNNTTLNQNQLFGNVIADHANQGATWNNPEAPGTYNANGSPDTQGFSIFQDPTVSVMTPVRYAPDDLTYGYLTPGNQIDGANAFIYDIFSDGHWNNGTYLYLKRTPRVYYGAPQSAVKAEYWIGSSSPTPLDFVNDANWSKEWKNRTSIDTSAGKIGQSALDFIPGMNYYVLQEWYQANPATTSSSTWVFKAGPTPAGPWTVIYTNTFSPQGWYNPVFDHKCISANSSNTSLTCNLWFSGNYNTATYYHPTYAGMTLYASSLSFAQFLGAGNVASSTTATSNASTLSPTPASSIGYQNQVTTFPITSAQTLAVAVNSNAGASIVSVSDLSGCTFAAKGSQQTIGSGFVQWYQGTGCGTNAADYVTVTFSAAGTYNAVLPFVINGPTPTYDTEVLGLATTATTVATPSFNTAYNSEIVTAVGWITNGDPVTCYQPSAGATQAAANVAATYVYPEYQVYAGPQTGKTIGYTLSCAAGTLNISAAAWGH